MSQIADKLHRAWSRRGFWACMWWPVSTVMWLLVTLRRFAYRRGWMQSIRLPVPVIVVGNRIVGGAGKTPTTISLIHHLQSQGFRPAVLTRGYKGETGGHALRLLNALSEHNLSSRDTGDEPMLIWRRTRVPIMIGRDRARAGATLLSSHPEVNILICDDGLQHLKLRRDIEIIVFDERGQGNGWLLPAGPLREPIHVAPTDDLVSTHLVLYNAPKPSTPLPGFMAQRDMPQLTSLEAWWGQAHPHGETLNEHPAPEMGSHVIALAGIAQPQRFFRHLQELGYVVQGIPLNDHADFADLPWADGIIDLVITEKDAIKLEPSRVKRERPLTRVWVATLHLHPEPGFWQALDQAVASLASCQPDAARAGS